MKKNEWAFKNKGSLMLLETCRSESKRNFVAIYIVLDKL